MQLAREAAVVHSPTHPLDNALVAGLDALEVDRRLVRANGTSGLAQRTLAFYLFDMHERGQAPLLGFRTARAYAESRLEMAPRRANELIQVGGMLCDLGDVDAAFRAGRLSWSKVVALLPVVRVSNQDVWIARAEQVSVARLKKSVAQVARGQKVTGESETGLPQPMVPFHADLRLDESDKLEVLRQQLMRERARPVTDTEVLQWFLEGYQPVEVDVEADAARRAACEDEETPDWLRREVLARDGYRCVHCGRRGKLHAHHVVFRESGGQTNARNLTAICLGCHGMVHAGLLRITGAAPDALAFADRHGNPLVPAARDADPVLETLPAGGHPPSTGLAPRTSPPRSPRSGWSGTRASTGRWREA
jgi:hypothetical protein